MSRWTDALLFQHGHLVKSVSAHLTEEWLLENDNGGENMPPYDNLIMFVDGGSDTPRAKRQGLSPENLVTILLMCPNVESLEVHITKPSEEEQDGGLAILQRRLKQIFRHLPHLRTLRLQSPSTLRLSEETIIDILQNLPLLASFRCVTLGTRTPDLSTPSLESHLACLPNLSHLSLVNCVGRDRAWISQVWTAPITSLELCFCSNLTITDAHKLINQLGQTLTRVALAFDEDYEEVMDRPALECTFGPNWAKTNRFTLPSLTSLMIVYPPRWNMLSSFQNCRKLSVIDYRGIPAGEWSPMVDLVCASTWPDLKSLELATPQRYDSSDWDFCAGIYKIRKFCRENKITFLKDSDE